MRRHIRKVVDDTRSRLTPAALQRLIRRFAGFSMVGAANFGLGISLQYVFLELIGTPRDPTYACLYTFGAWLSYQLNARYVFKAQRTRRRMLAFFAVYGTSLLLGLGTLNVYDVILPQLEPFYQVLLSLPVTTAWNFVGSSLVLRQHPEDLSVEAAED